MFLRNLVMAIILALLYLVFFYTLSTAAKTILKDSYKYKLFITMEITKTVFWGLCLCTILTLLHLTNFTLSDIFLCISFIILYRIIGG